jgi:hypothetical protein
MEQYALISDETETLTGEEGSEKAILKGKKMAFLKEKNVKIFGIKISLYELVGTRRSIVVSLPLR